MTALPLEPLPARVLAGRYTLLEPIGRGGMSVVWRAEDQLLRRLVAVKELLLPRTLPPDEVAVLRERLLREARAACAVIDAAAVTVYDVIEEGGTPYLVMELVRARTLAQVVAERGPLPVVEVTAIGLALLGALAAAHRADVVHRDVKPGNVLITDDGRAMLTDFGIAATSTEIGLTAEGVLLGSPAYVAPERARGAAGGPESDLWSLGSTLYTAVEGTPAFAGASQLDTLHAVVDGRRRRCEAAGPLAPVLAALLDRPASRRPDAGELERLLRGVLTPPEVAVPSPHAGAARPATLVAPPVATAAPPAPRSGPPATAAAASRAPLLVGLALVGLVTAWAVVHAGDRGASPPAPTTVVAGARLSLPAGWQVGAGTPSVSVTTAAGDDAAGTLIAADARAAARVRTHRLVAVEGSRAEATWDYVEPGRHVLVRARTVDGAVWQATASIAEADWPTRQAEAHRVLASFRPPGADG